MLLRPRSVAKSPEIAFGWIILSDLPRVLEIDAAAYGRLAWSSEVFRKSTRGQYTVAIGAHDTTGKILGYSIHEMVHGGYGLIRLAVDPACQRRGVGRALVNRVMSKLTPDRPRLVASVPDVCLAGHCLLRSAGMRAIRWADGRYAMDDCFGRGVGGYRFEAWVKDMPRLDAAKDAACVGIDGRAA